MKLKYILYSLFSTLFLASCTEEQVADTFDDFNLSTSYISIPVEGGSATVTITAAEAWEFDPEINSKGDETYPIPAWLTISQTSGEAGETELSFSADADDAGREAELKIVSGGKNLYLKVRQGEISITEATCKEVNEGADGKTYRVTGIVTKIVNTTYGNWYLADETGEVYIYGTLDAEGQTKNFSSLGLEVGDKVTVEGPKTTYGTTVELVDVTVLSIEKALLKMLSESAEIAKEGGLLEVRLASKGKGAYFEMSDDYSSWVCYSTMEYIDGVPSKIERNPADTVVYRFNIAPNDGAARSAVITFRANEGAPLEYRFSQLGGIADVSVEEFLAAEVDANAQYRVDGVIAELHYKYNNNIYVQDATGKMYAYKVDANGVTFAVGDFVTLIGNRAEYKGDPQMGNPVVEEHTANAHISIAEFLTKEDSKDVYYCLTGTIVSIANTIYGNVTIKDENGDEIYVYGILPERGATGDAKKGLIEAKGIKEGDTITIVGNKASYKGSPQVGNGVYVSHTAAE